MIINKKLLIETIKTNGNVCINYATKKCSSCPIVLLYNKLNNLNLENCNDITGDIFKDLAVKIFIKEYGEEELMETLL